MQCLIIDDNQKTSAALIRLLEALPGTKDSGMFSNIHHVVQPYLIRSLMLAEQIDVVFIRARLWDYTVFEKIAADKMPVLVFLSGGKERIKEEEDKTVSFQLREPYSYESVRRILRQIVLRPEKERPHFFFVRHQARYHKIGFDDIELVELMKGSYIRLHSKTESFLLPGSLSGMMERLPDDRFIRVSDRLIIREPEF